MAIENEEETKTGIRFANDFNDELKDRIKAEAAKRIEELLEQTDFSMNDLSQLAGVSHGSVKGRAKTLASASDIVTAVLDGVRATVFLRRDFQQCDRQFIVSHMLFYDAS